MKLQIIIGAALFLTWGLYACSGAGSDQVQLQAEREDQIIREYLRDNKIEATKLPSGMYYQRLQSGAAGEKPVRGDTARVHYTGNILYGYVFDSSRFKNTPFEFRLGVGNVIRGWNIGVLEMQRGERGIFYIPSALGYGASGTNDARTLGFQSIPPNSILVFDIELLSIKRQ